MTGRSDFDPAAHPFSNGTERYGWEARNCWSCWKNTPPERGTNFRCAIQGAILRATDLADEPVPVRIQERLGWDPAADLFVPDCPEREETRPPSETRRGPRPAKGQQALMFGPVGYPGDGRCGRCGVADDEPCGDPDSGDGCG